MKTQSSLVYPSAIKLVTYRGFQVGLVVVTLFLTLYYNIAYYWNTPLTGVEWDYIDNARSTVKITQVLPGSPGQAAGLQEGDRLLVIDGRAVVSANRPFYAPKRTGESVRYTVERAGQRLTFDVLAGDYWQHSEYLLAILPMGLLSLLVSALGLLLCLLSAPQDTRARLVGAVWLLAGQAVAAGGPGYANGGWFTVDVYLTTLAVGGYASLAAYLYFPAASFSNRARLLILRAHLALTLLTLAAYAWQRMIAASALPPEALVSGTIIRYIFILTWLVNLGLLLANRFAVHDPETKRQTQIILLGTLLGVLPGFLLSSLPGLLLGPQFVILPGNVSVLALIFIPLSYGYVIRQHKLLKIDLLVNRALAWFILVALTLVASAGVVGLLTLWHGSQQILLLGGVVAAVLVTGLRNRIQVWVDHMLYGVSYDFGSVTTHLSERLSHIAERRDLDEALRVEFAQPMRIQQSAVLLVDQSGRLQLPWPDGSSFGMFPGHDAICLHLLDARRPARASALNGLWDERATACWAAYAWGRVFAPLVYEHSLRGVLVLGDRLTGDYYSDQDMEHIHTVSQLAALAVANLATVEVLRGLGQRLVQIDEEHRRGVARELHDNVLRRISFFQDQPDLRPGWAVSLEEIADSVRQVIDIERTPLLEGDIALALEDLINKLRPLAAGEDTILSLRNLLPEPAALDNETNTTVYRIVQEALSNALKHAHAANAVVTLKKEGDVLVIEVEDDGVGMEDTDHEPSGHYGLLGMRERAAMIGATLTITSVPDERTTVRVRLKR